MSVHLQQQVYHEQDHEIDDEQQLFTEINRVVQKNFNIGFEFLTDAFKLLSGK